jgi:hypothetical protein
MKEIDVLRRSQFEGKISRVGFVHGSGCDNAWIALNVSVLCDDDLLKGIGSKKEEGSFIEKVSYI